MSSIIKHEDGSITIPADFDIDADDNKTDTKFAINTGDINPDGIAYLLGYGFKQSVGDSHAGVCVGRKIKVDGKDIKVTDANKAQLAKPLALARVDAIQAGTVKAGGGRGDEVTTEILAIARKASGLSVAKFNDKYDTDAGAGARVNLFILARVRDAFRNKSIPFKATDPKHAKLVSDAGAKLRRKAEENIKARAIKFDIDLSDI